MMKLKKNIKYLVGSHHLDSLSIEPYNEEVINFLKDFSLKLDKSKYIKQFPDLKTLAFFCRKQNLINLKKKFYNFSPETRLGLGLIFHITPSNVPTNFFYSLIFGLLTGNTNIVKVPSKIFDQIDIICNITKSLLKKKYSNLKKFITIVRYSSNDEYTQKTSLNCDGRIIWGGDRSVENIKNFKLKQKSTELTFGDRYSLCLIKGSEFLKLKFSEKIALTLKFYNDTYTADQNACSSPHLILWLGKDNKKAKNIFWSLLNKIVNNKYDFSNMASVEKYTELCKKIVTDKNIKNSKTFSKNIYTITLKKLNKDITNYRGKWGFFYEYDIISLKILKKFISKKFQTLTYFGIKKSTLKDLIIKSKLQGIDRIVPIGQALDISFFWDGYDINKSLTRVIDIK